MIRLYSQSHLNNRSCVLISRPTASKRQRLINYNYAYRSISIRSRNLETKTIKPVQLSQITSNYIPSSLFKPSEDAGKLTQATFYSEKVNSEGWMLFEKYDGVRSLWNHQDKKFYSRFGKELKMPEYIIESMPPDISLDGEFWFGRGNFNETRKIVSKSDPSTIPWEKFRYMVFDIPSELNMMYKDRYSILEQVLSKNEKSSKYITLAPFIICKGHDHLMDYSSEIVSKGGEGIILRNPDSYYKLGKSKDYLKFKMFRDCEAKVMKQISPNRWECQLPNGVIFHAKADESLVREREIKEGDIISLKYTRYSSIDGKPLSPLLFRYRIDMDWDNLVNDIKKPKKLKVPISRQVVDKLSQGYWSDWKNRRKFFDDYAITKGFDPKDTTYWYNLKMRDILSHPKVNSILYLYKGSLQRALADAYPEIQWDTLQFKGLKKGYWQEQSNVRNFFEKLASRKGFDYNDPTNWYKLKTEDVLSLERGSSLLSQYRYSLQNALFFAFPNLNWDKSMFHTHKGYWKDINNIKLFFENFAKSHGFDPNEPSNWYNLTHQKLTSEIKPDFRHFGNWQAAIMQVYPRSNWDITKFGKVKPGYWQDKVHVREFLEQFARSRGFDPNDHEKWYEIRRKDIVQFRKGKAALQLYNGSISKALMDIYPDIQWNKAKFRLTPEFWQEKFASQLAENIAGTTRRNAEPS